MENESDGQRLLFGFRFKERREDKPADSKHGQSHGGSLLLVRPIVQLRVEHALPDDGRLPGSARLHVTSGSGGKEGAAKVSARLVHLETGVKWTLKNFFLSCSFLVKI